MLYKYNYLFTDREDRDFAEELIQYVIFGEKPETTPALWQDVEIFIRYKKRDVWRLSDEMIENAMEAIRIYRLKYVTEHLKKAEIVEVLNEFFAQERGDEENKTLAELLEKKFHAPVDDLFLVQEKHVVTKDEIEELDEIFEYPQWVEFTSEARDVLFEKILNDELTDEQIDYVLGASDDMKNYDKWFKVVKHVLITSENAHTVWAAGDILNIIWMALPDEEDLQKWMRDQIFEIYWPRVGGVWPILNQDKIDFEVNDETKILRDSIQWLECLKDLRERLPELGEEYGLANQQDLDERFLQCEGFLVGRINIGDGSMDEWIRHFFELTEMSYSRMCLEHLRETADRYLIPKIRKAQKKTEADKMIAVVERSIKHAEKNIRDSEREGEVMAKMIRGEKESS